MALPPVNSIRDQPRFGVVRLGLALACLTLPGCHQGNQQVYRDLYQRELRLQEDEIYRLEDCIKEYQGLIRGYRVELDEMESRLDTTGKTGAALAPQTNNRIRSLLDTRPGERTPPPRRDVFDEPDTDNTPELEMPSIDLGEPSEAPLPRPVVPPPIDPLPSGPAPDGPPPIDVPLPETPAYERGYEPTEDLPAPLGIEPIGDAQSWNQATPTASALPPEPLGDAVVDGYAGPPLETGEATLVVLVQPASLTGEPTLYNGEASLMLVEPATGRKLARWDFTPEEVTESWRPDAGQPVLDLAVVLPERLPSDQPLELWVRLVDQHGEKVLSKRQLVLNQLASIDQARLAVVDQPEPLPFPLDPSATEIVQANDSQTTSNNQWRASDRTPYTPAALVVETQPSDSGWNDSSTPQEPRKIELASHEEAAKPLSNTALPKPADSGAPAWSPKR